MKKNVWKNREKRYEKIPRTECQWYSGEEPEKRGSGDSSTPTSNLKKKGEKFAGIKETGQRAHRHRVGGSKVRGHV